MHGARLAHALQPGRDGRVRDGRRALDDGVLMTLQLLLLSTSPIRRLVGNPEDRAALERFLGLHGTRRP